MPPEVIATSIKNHQKCFALKDAKTGKLANRYLLVSNMIAKDGGKQIVAGNNKVIAARLSDAKFFWDQDRKSAARTRCCRSSSTSPSMPSSAARASA